MVIQRFVYASSAAVYGDVRRVPIGEDGELAPLNPYGVSKLAGEKQCVEFWERHQLRTICLRYFNVFGPRQSSAQYSGVITAFMKKLTHQESPIIYGDGLQTRDFVHVSDVVAANILALDSERNGEVYNVAAGRETTINELAQQLISISGHPSITPEHTSERQGEIRRSAGNIRKAIDELNYRPRTDLRRNLVSLWNWYTRQRRESRAQ